ncbi:hypothetical protein KRM28CT15_02530 [Krasilnikovia sp. M28-CT-15]
MVAGRVVHLAGEGAMRVSVPSLVQQRLEFVVRDWSHHRYLLCQRSHHTWSGFDHLGARNPAQPVPWISIPGQGSPSYEQAGNLVI